MAAPLEGEAPTEQSFAVPTQPARHRVEEPAGPLGLIDAALDRSGVAETGELPVITDDTSTLPVVPEHDAPNVDAEGHVLPDDVAARAVAGMRRPKPAQLSPEMAEANAIETPRGVFDFGRRGPSPIVNGLLQVTLLALALAGCYLAYQDPSRVTIGVAGALSVLLLIVAFRSPAGPKRVRIEDGILAVNSGESRYKFDLANPRVQLEMPYPPTSRRWRVQVHRTGMAPFEIDASMVDPQEFTEAIRQFRPNL
jgi:hypothetical protein